MPDDHRPDVEALLRELRPTDLDFPDPPESNWVAIAEQLHADGVGVRPPRRPSVMLLVAAVALLALSAAVVIGGIGARGTSVVAVADLTYDPAAFDPLGATATATARLVDRGDDLAIVIDDARLPDVGDEAELELWMLATDDRGSVVDIVPVAPIDGAGTFVVPVGLDVDSHRIVDISIEPRDGDASHSGRSILRGTLTDA